LAEFNRRPFTGPAVFFWRLAGELPLFPARFSPDSARSLAKQAIDQAQLNLTYE
jgi:hypothetical protein